MVHSYCTLLCAFLHERSIGFVIFFQRFAEYGFRALRRHSTYVFPPIACFSATIGFPFSHFIILCVHVLPFCPRKAPPSLIDRYISPFVSFSTFVCWFVASDFIFRPSPLRLFTSCRGKPLVLSPSLGQRGHWRLALVRLHKPRAEPGLP